MRRVDFLILDARRISRNLVNEDNTVSISDEEVLRYLNDAKDRLQSLISAVKANAKIFTVEKIIAAVANQDGYSVPERVFYNKEVQQIEFSASGGATDYVLLKKLEMMNRDTASSNYPSGYYRRGNKFYPVPVTETSAGAFRVLFERQLDDMDKRRGSITAITGLSTTGFTSITIGSDADETSSPNLSTIDYVCLNSVDGEVKLYNVPVSSYDSGTNVLTPRTGFVFEEALTTAQVNGNQAGVTSIVVDSPGDFAIGDDVEFINQATSLIVLRTVTSVSSTAIGISGATVNVNDNDLLYRNPPVRIGDYVTFHKYSTTHCKAPDACEPYLVHYAAESLLHKDSSNDIVRESRKLQDMEAQILGQIASQTSEVQFIPELSPNEWW
ncbi:MAG: hypothetical protein E6Q97_36195 [Desulfurellales bacterium]|nr:MAG: hypothetical protein E6Q97_36195 [Desulfurellales bacterium]